MVSEQTYLIARDDEFMDYSIPEDDYKVRPGNELAGEMQTNVAEFQTIVSPEELNTLVTECVKVDIDRDDLSYPPEVDEVVGRAADFFATYLYDTDADRVEVTERYVAALIEKLEIKHGGRVIESDEDLESYVLDVRSQAEAFYELAA